MGLELTFFGGVDDFEAGELGGVQCKFEDTELETKFMLDFGQRPDHTSEFYGFPYKPKSFQHLALAEFLQLYPKLKDLYRHDYEHARGRRTGELPLDGILATHSHYDHIGGLSLVRHDMPVHMSQLSKQIAWIWQYTSGRTINQFVDLIDQFSLVPDTAGGQKFAAGLEAVLPRDIKVFKDYKPFKIGNITTTPFPVDHSLPGACGFIVETSVGKIGISGDIRLRGRRREDTERFVDSLLEQRVSYLLWEGSLLHFEHNGTEDDVSEVVSELLKGKAFAAVAYPPRDFDRLTSLYKAAKANDRMLVISPAQAKSLSLLNGVNGCPRLNWKYIGVLLPRKRKGLIDREKFDEHLIEGDYYGWERDLLGKRKWEITETSQSGHSSKIQRVSIEDIKEHQDKFLVYIPLANMIDILEEVRPEPNSIYIRSHPAPWTEEMEFQEQRQIRILKAFDMYDGPKQDYLTRTITRNMHQVHITGHLNRDETRGTLGRFSCPIIPYHCMNPKDFVDDVASHTEVIVPQRGEGLVLK